MKKHIIWSNIDLNIEDWREGYEEFCEINDIEYDPDNENAIYEYMIETNDEYLEDEQMNLDCEVEGRILIIGDLGLWNGRRQGYRIINSKNIKNILALDDDYTEFYGDGYNIRGTGIHHDGRNHYLYRVIREDRNIDNLLDAIYNGEEINKSKLNYYTKSLYKNVAKIYGW